MLCPESYSRNWGHRMTPVRNHHPRVILSQSIQDRRNFQMPSTENFKLKSLKKRWVIGYNGTRNHKYYQPRPLQILLRRSNVTWFGGNAHSRLQVGATSSFLGSSIIYNFSLSLFNLCYHSTPSRILTNGPNFKQWKLFQGLLKFQQLSWSWNF